MGKIHYLLLIILSGLIVNGCSNQSSKPEPEKHYVILLGGQSNMVGQGKISEISNIDIPDNIKFYNLNKPPDFTPHPRRFGPEVGLWRILEKEFPDSNFILIKYAIGGSSMFDWSPDYDKEKAKITGHPEYGNMFETLVQKTDSITKNYNAEFLALLWMQGGRDAKVAEASKEYHKNFSAFIHAIRKRLSVENLPVIYGLSNPDPNKFLLLETIQTAQRRIDKEIENTYLIDLKGSSDLDKWEDKIHYSTEGQLDLGKKFGEKVTEIIQMRE